MAETGHNTKNYEEQGGAAWVVGGTLTVAAGGALILPSADPHVVGALWNNAGTITVSAG